MAYPRTPLEVYVDYTVLPASQVAVMCWSMDTLYGLLLPDEEWSPPFRRAIRFGVVEVPPFPFFSEGASSSLCIEQAQTGNSITFSFAGRGQPAGIAWKGSDVDVTLPSWTAAALGVGAVLLGTGIVYERYLETEYRKVQTEGQHASNRLIEAQIEKTRAETEEIVDRIKRGKQPVRQSERRRQKAIERSVQAFHGVANATNVVNVQINGVPLTKGGTDAANEP
ncbi:MAG: hypothetical protein EON54_15750 [Alcaligenaceae bacterium]|nr:MAG: hypothetical protein EON54_15750 [Alcaligenaceae bacterium]